MASITCGNCGKTHYTAADVRACYAGTLVTCTWMMEVRGEDGFYVVECGGAVTEDARGYECEFGHSHVYAEVRHREGWDYASDAEEADMMRRHLLGAVGPDGASI